PTWEENFTLQKLQATLGTLWEELGTREFRVAEWLGEDVAGAASADGARETTTRSALTIGGSSAWDLGGGSTSSTSAATTRRGPARGFPPLRAARRCGRDLRPPRGGARDADRRPALPRPRRRRERAARPRLPRRSPARRPRRGGGGALPRAGRRSRARRLRA